MKTVQDAIETSLQTNQIVTLPWSAEAEENLYSACDDSAENGPVMEFWGDWSCGCWRVHLTHSE